MTIPFAPASPHHERLDGRDPIHASGRVAHPHGDRVLAAMKSLRTHGEVHAFQAPRPTLHWKCSRPEPDPVNRTVALRLRWFTVIFVILVFGLALGADGF